MSVHSEATAISPSFRAIRCGRSTVVRAHFASYPQSPASLRPVRNFLQMASGSRTWKPGQPTTRRSTISGLLARMGPMLAKWQRPWANSWGGAPPRTSWHSRRRLSSGLIQEAALRCPTRSFSSRRWAPPGNSLAFLPSVIEQPSHGRELVAQRDRACRVDEPRT
jgi:hypothetical protein